MPEMIYVCTDCSKPISAEQLRRLVGQCPRCHMKGDDDLTAEYEKLSKRLNEVATQLAFRQAARMAQGQAVRHKCVCSADFVSYLQLLTHVSEGGNGHAEQRTGNQPRPSFAGSLPKKAKPVAPSARHTGIVTDFSEYE